MALISAPSQSLPRTVLTMPMVYHHPHSPVHSYSICLGHQTYSLRPSILNQKPPLFLALSQPSNLLDGYLLRCSLNPTRLYMQSTTTKQAVSCFKHLYDKQSLLCHSASRHPILFKLLHQFCYSSARLHAVF